MTGHEGWAELPIELRTVISTHLEGDLFASWIEGPNINLDGNLPGQLYNALLLPPVSPLDHVRRRINLVLFHELREGFKARFSNKKKDPLTVYLVQEVGLDDEKAVKRHCADWSFSGKKYKTLSESSGGYGGLLIDTSISQPK